VKRDKLFWLLLIGLALLLVLVAFARHEAAVSRVGMCAPANPNCTTPPGTPPQ
jgi:hypothetical protein